MPTTWSIEIDAAPTLTSLPVRSFRNNAVAANQSYRLTHGSSRVVPDSLRIARLHPVSGRRGAGRLAPLGDAHARDEIGEEPDSQPDAVTVERGCFEQSDNRRSADGADHGGHVAERHAVGFAAKRPIRHPPNDESEAEGSRVHDSLLSLLNHLQIHRAIGRVRQAEDVEAL